MPIEVILPKVDMDMSSGTIAGWHKSEGDQVEHGEALFDIETDKAVMEIESPGTGKLHYVSANPGDEVPIGHAVAWLFAEGEDVVLPAGALQPGTASGDAPSRVEVATSEPAQAEISEARPTAGVRATPLARRIARDLGIDLQSVRGSGPRGRITRTDVETAGASATRGDASTTDLTAGTGAEKTAQELGLSYTSIPVSKMLAVIASRLTLSKSTIPHFYLNADIEMDALLSLRGQLNAALGQTGAKSISVNDLLIKGCAGALRAVPDANASWDGGNIIRYGGAHISVAVAVDGGLLTPVIRNAHEKDLRTISTEVADLAERAKTGRLSAAQCRGGSFSLSNLGMFGVKSFNAIINPPESMILAVGQAAQQFIPDADGNPKLATIMSVTLSCDHRVVDGALGAVWLSKFKELVETPALLLLCPD